MAKELKALLLDVLRSAPITFERYMEFCLYHPDLGYYMQPAVRTGTGGDYFTSSDLHPVFARLLARQAENMWQVVGRPSRFTWVEMGAGRGSFVLEFLSFAKQALPEFFGALEYVVVEPGEKVRERLLETLKDWNPSGSIRLLASLDELTPVTGCFFSNELVDAFSVAAVTRERGRLKEVYVGVSGGKLCEQLGPISDSEIAADIARYANQLDEGSRAEVNRRAKRWIAGIAEKLEKGFVLTIDYGDLAHRLYSPDRPRGTLLAYRGHSASEDFYSTPGECDLTAHVNFSALMDAGEQAGLETLGFITQEKFLLGIGEPNQFADLYDPGQAETEKLEARMKLKRLIFPGDFEGAPGMGTVFKVLIQSRGLNRPQLLGLNLSR